MIFDCAFRGGVMHPKQLVIVSVAVALLGGGIGIVFISLASTTTPDPIRDDPIKSRAPLDIFTNLQGTRYEEAYTDGQQPFLFRNKVDAAILVGVNWKNCQCAGVDICLAPPEWQELSDEELYKKVNDRSLRWTALDKDAESKGFSIPSKA